MTDEEKSKYITEAGEYLVPFKKAKNYLTKLPEHQFSQQMYGIVGGPAFENPKWSVLEWSRELVEKVPSHIFYTTYDFRATIRNSKEKTVQRLGGVKVTDFQTSETQISEDKIKDLLLSLGPVKEFNNINEFFEMVELAQPNKKTVISEPILVLGRVTSIGRIATSGNRAITLDALDDSWELGLPVWMPPYIGLDFGRHSHVIALGELRRNRQGNIQMNAYGVYPLPEYTLAPEPEETSNNGTPEE